MISSNSWLFFNTKFPIPSAWPLFSPSHRQLHFFFQTIQRSLSLSTTSAVALAASGEFMWLYKWQACPWYAMHLTFFPLHLSPSKARCSALDNVMSWLYCSGCSLWDSLFVGKTSKVLREHYEDFEAKAGLLCSGILWTRLSSIPQGWYPYIKSTNILISIHVQRFQTPPHPQTPIISAKVVLFKIAAAAGFTTAWWLTKWDTKIPIGTLRICGFQQTEHIKIPTACSS